MPPVHSDDFHGTNQLLQGFRRNSNLGNKLFNSIKRSTEEDGQITDCFTGLKTTFDFKALKAQILNVCFYTFFIVDIHQPSQSSASYLKGELYSAHLGHAA